MKPRPPGTAAKDSGAELPPFAPAAFAAGLRAATGKEPAPELVSRLLAHYEELRRWAPRVDLVGPAFRSELFERHYGEALAALEILPPGPGRLLDVGSGAGFPGFVLAAARPDLESVLLEPRERRRAFLEAAARRAGVALRVVGGRVSTDPAEFDPTLEGFTIVTVRALQLKPSAWQALTARLAPGARLLEWTGETPLDLPASFRPDRKLRLSGERRFLRESILTAPPGSA